MENVLFRCLIKAYQLCAGASETAGNQGEGEGENPVLPEAERGPEGHQGQISGEGAVTFFQTNISFRLSNGFSSSKIKPRGCEGQASKEGGDRFLENFISSCSHLQNHFYSVYHNNISFFLPEECQGQALGDD